MPVKQLRNKYFLPVLLCCVLIAGPAYASGPKDISTLKILPTLKGHMARLGSLMNFLFRNIDDEKYTTELISTVTEMQLLINNSRKFKPDKALSKLPAEKHEKALVEFKACIKGALEKLELLLKKISDLEDRTPDKPVLLELDLLRRDCHSKFG